MSVHALSRLPRLNKPGYVNIDEQDVMQLLHTLPNYREGKERLAYFSEELQLSVIKNIKTDDVITIVRAKRPKGDWTDV